MPIYVYKCCDQEWESFHRIEDRDAESCPVCGKTAERVFRGARVAVFKPDYYEHIRPDKVLYIESKRQLKEECKRASEEFGIERMAESLL